MLKDFISKKKTLPPVIVLYGEAGVGKSTIGTTFPNPFFLDLDDGLRAFDVTSADIKTLDDFENVLKALETEPIEEFKTIVIDTIDELENLLTPVVCKEYHVVNLIKTKFGEGYIVRADRLNNYIDRIINLREKGLIPVFICHSQITTISKPECPDYNYRTLKLQKRSADYLTEKSDFVGYVGNKLVVDSSKNAIETESRCIQIEYSPAHLSKVRVINAPNSIAMNGSEIMKLFE